MLYTCPPEALSAPGMTAWRTTKTELAWFWQISFPVFVRTNPFRKLNFVVFSSQFCQWKIGNNSTVDDVKLLEFKKTGVAHALSWAGVLDVKWLETDKHDVRNQAWVHTKTYFPSWPLFTTDSNGNSFIFSKTMLFFMVKRTLTFEGYRYFLEWFCQQLCPKV